MLVCICKGISDRRINEEVRRGNATLGAIQHCCQAGTDCGACVPKIRKLLAAVSTDSRGQKQG